MAEALSVLFDIKRLIAAERMNNAYWGINKYAMEIFSRLSSGKFPLELTPIHFTTLSCKHLKVGDIIRELPLIKRVQKKIRRKVIFRNQTKFSILSLLASRILYLLNKAFLRRIFDFFFVDHLRELDYDIYFSPFTPLPPTNVLEPKTRRIITVHDVIHLKCPELWVGPYKTPSIKRSIDSIDTEKDFVICISESTRKDLASLIEIDEKRTCVIHLGVDEVFFDRDRKHALPVLEKLGITPQNYILALAQFEKRKNIERLIDAYSLIKGKYELKEDLLLVANSKQSKKKVEIFLKNAGIDTRGIKILTDVNNRLLASLYSNAKLFAFISLYEGFGLPLAEAMASGCPILASNVSSIPEVVGDAAVMADPKDTEAVAKEMAKILSEPKILKSLSGKSLRRAKEFTWEKTAAKTYEFFRYVKHFNG
jgi:glycosyltransferase involved in cell wall biosynthesis